MADPFGTGAGIVGVIGLAIQITQVLVQFGMDWKDVPDNVKSFMAELGTLKTVLSETNTNILLNTDFAEAFQGRRSLLLSQLGPSAPSTTETKFMLEICKRELESLLKDLTKRGEGHRLGWERLKGAFLAKDTRDSVVGLSRQCQILNNMLSIDAAILGASTYKEVRDARTEQQEWHQVETKTSSAIQSGVDQSNRWQESQDCQIILDWFTTIDYAAQQSDFIGRRQSGTGQWLLDSTEFQTWLNATNQTLFCPGIPGAGKTILTSIVIEELTARFRTDKSIGIAYLYCNFRRQHEQTVGDLLTSLLKQLTQALPSLPDTIKSLYDSHQDMRTRPSFDEISGALHLVVSMYSRVFIVVDALDECQASHSCEKSFLSELFSVQAKSGANLFVTSRFIPEITKGFQESLLLEIRASEHDVRRYVDGHMSHLPSFVGRNSDLQEDVKTGIVEAVAGMFLLAQLHLESLVGKRSTKAIRTALKNLPSGSDAYDHAYKDAMIRIEGQVTDQEDLAKQVLSWITCAERPLTTWELQHALAVELGESQLDKENLPDIEDLVSVCAGLVTIDEESNVIRLVHYTTQEYFERTQNQWFPDATADITAICVTYLSFDVFEHGFCRSDDEFNKRLRSHPFFEYAVQNWGHHARNISTLSPDLSHQVVGFLMNEAKVNAASQGLVATLRGSPGSNQSQKIQKRVTGLHLISYFAAEAIAKLLLEKGKLDADSKDSYGQTPLSWAAENGNNAIVKLLLETGKVDVDSKDKCGQTPLSWAALNGHEAVVRMLLETDKVDADLKDGYGRTPLSWAARKGRVAVVQLLLETGKVDVNSRDSRHSSTPLLWATRNGHEAVVKLLLQTENVDVNSKDKNNWTPLLWATNNRSEAIVKLLLETGQADTDSKDDIYKQTPITGYKARAQGYSQAFLKQDPVRIE